MSLGVSYVQNSRRYFIGCVFGGLFAQNSLGTELASVLVIGGAVVGSVNVLIEVARWFKK